MTGWTDGWPESEPPGVWLFRAGRDRARTLTVESLCGCVLEIDADTGEQLFIPCRLHMEQRHADHAG